MRREDRQAVEELVHRARMGSQGGVLEWYREIHLKAATLKCIVQEGAVNH